MSITAMPDTKPEERFSIDEIANDGKAVLQKGGSPNDESDMIRMGKKQELRVSPASNYYTDTKLNLYSATSNSLVSSASLRFFNRPGNVYCWPIGSVCTTEGRLVRSGAQLEFGSA